MKNKGILIAAALTVISGICGLLIGRITAPALPKQQPTGVVAQDKDDMVEQREGGYRYINPLWECDNFNPSSLTSIVEIRDALQEYIQKVINEKKAVHVSVYFRDLNNGPWVGINEKNNFSPASLLKVPIMIAALKKNEIVPAFLQEKIPFTAYRDDGVRPNLVDSTQLQLGNTYSIEDLIYRMIVYSDNQAKELLVENIGNELSVKVLRDIGIDITGMTAEDDFISVKDYSSYFRLLYNATYLSRELSEKALEILSRSGFPGGISAGVPKDWTVAHKFGERAFVDSNVKQLHDCGIIYRPGAPYLLCVMTRGNDFNQLTSVIAGVSELVYKQLTKPKQ